ncbi:MAG: IS66 family transposase [Gammaproteobacteria bacterium]
MSVPVSAGLLRCDHGVVDPAELCRAELIALVAVQAGQIEALQVTNAGLQVTNAGLQARVERLERLISRNSGNSSMPPSSDGGPGRGRPVKRSRETRDGDGEGATSARSKGKQRGAAGTHLGWADAPDARLDRFPEGVCGCGADLSAALDLGVTDAYQQTEVPVLTATVTQYDLHTLGCACGAVHTAVRPPGAGSDPGRVGYGPNLRAWCVYLMVAHALPVHRCVALLESLTGARPSVGFVHSTLSTAATVLAAVADRIRARIEAAPAVAVDETPLRVGPATPAPGRTRAGKTKKAKKRAEKYLIVAATPTDTWYTLGDRDLDTFKEIDLVKMAGVIVHDRYFLYDHPDLHPGLAGLVHQLCCAHLIRDAEDAAQTYPDELWPTQIQDALRELIHHANTARGNGATAVPAEVMAAPLRALRNGVRVGLAQVRRVPGPKSSTKQPLGRLLLEVLRDREDDVLRFTTDLRIPPTSNDAERAVRPAKTQQKISGRLTSEDRTRDRYLIRGVMATAAKQGVDQFGVLRDAFTGHLWLPPAPA